MRQGLTRSHINTFTHSIDSSMGLRRWRGVCGGIAYRNGWISEEKMHELAKPMLKNQYGQYLLKVIDEMKEEVNSGTLVHV